MSKQDQGLQKASTPSSRRAFLRAAGATAAVSALVLSGCSDDSPEPDTPTTGTLTYGSGNTGLLNYLYSLHQLSLAVYQVVVTTFPGDMPANERAIFTDMRDHELIYTEFYKYNLGATNTLATIPFVLTSLTLTTRTGVLAASRQIEDASTAAYNDVLSRFAIASTSDAVNIDYLLLLGKIASVKARHAAYVRDLQTPNSFAADDVVVATGQFAGLEITQTPTEVIALLGPYFPVTVLPASIS